MGNKKYLSFPSKSSSSQTPSSWPWPNPCTTTPKTLSFRAPQRIFNTMNSAFHDPTNPNEFIDAPEIFLEEDEEEEEDSIETLIRGLSSERLLFDQPDETSSILESVVNDQKNRVQSTECFAISVESRDPLVDFKKSMEEMVEAHDLKDWDCLEELLGCYLKVNNKSNHGYIIGAFVEILVGLGFSSSSNNNNNSFRSHSLDFIQCSSSTTHSFTSPMESYTSSSSSISPCVSSLLDVDDDVEKPATVNVVTSS